jgi:hypothetical protein
MKSNWRNFSQYIPFFALLGLFFSSKVSAQTVIGTTTDMPVPTQHSGEPNLFATKDQLYMSWIEYLKDTTHALVYSKLKDGQWAQPITIAQGKNWFVNWADFPSLAVFGDGKTVQRGLMIMIFKFHSLLMQAKHGNRLFYSTEMAYKPNMVSCPLSRCPTGLCLQRG